MVFRGELLLLSSLQTVYALSVTQRIRTALYGGAFDPPHNGHLMAAAVLLDSGLVDEIWIVPSGDRPDKSDLSPAADRLAMTRIAFEEAFNGRRNIKISDIHCSSEKGVGYGTIDLIDYCTKEFKDREFFLLIGSELIADLPRWKNSEVLRDRAKFLVIERMGMNEYKELPGFSMKLVPNPHSIGMSLSSTVIKELLYSNVSVAGLIPSSVKDFIARKKLYVRS